MKEIIHKCVEVLKEGGLILYPTDTIWGIGCDASNESAVKKVFQLKQREDAKSLITMVSNDGMLNRVIPEVPAIGWDLIDESVSPLTIIYDESRGLAPNVIAEDKSTAVRLTSHEFCKKMIDRFNRPIVSTSANISGEGYPKSFSDMDSRILEGVDYVVNLPGIDQGTGQPSSIIRLSNNGEVKIIRK